MTLESSTPFPPEVLRLAAALMVDSDEALVLGAPDGTLFAINGGQPIADLIGGDAGELLTDAKKTVHADDFQVLADGYAAAVTTPGVTIKVRFRVHARTGQTLLLRATFVNRLDDPTIHALIARIRMEDGESLDVSVDVDGEAPPASWRVGELQGKQAFMNTVQQVIDRKERNIWQLERFARSATKDRRYDYSLVLLELDRFKMLLGGFGQKVLDKLVAEVMKRLAAVLRGQDFVAHLGGGEFGILLDRVGAVEHATRIADAILTVLEDRFNIQGHPISVSPVIGIATSERRYAQAKDLVRDASAAASRAFRRRGRRREAFRTMIRLEDKKRIGLMADMQDQLGTDNFYVVYQPIVRISDESLHGFEALLRWRHPQLGMVSPATFIPLAEESGLIRPLGHWVLVEACKAMAEWNAGLSREHPISISVNVSALQLVDTDLRRDVEKVLADTKLAPEMLRLEITESVVLDNIEAASEAIAQLKLMGVRFSLDDFGTGYSSLSYLERLPYDTLKIDRSFLHGDGPLQDRAILRAIISLGQSLGLDVVAEGVETPVQLAGLKGLGCTLAQGYHFAKPMKRERAAALIHTGRAW